MGSQPPPNSPLLPLPSDSTQQVNHISKQQTSVAKMTEQTRPKNHPHLRGMIFVSLSLLPLCQQSPKGHRKQNEQTQNAASLKALRLYCAVLCSAQPTRKIASSTRDKASPYHITTIIRSATQKSIPSQDTHCTQTNKHRRQTAPRPYRNLRSIHSFTSRLDYPLSKLHHSLHFLFCQVPERP